MVAREEIHLHLRTYGASDKVSKRLTLACSEVVADIWTSERPVRTQVNLVQPCKLYDFLPRFVRMLLQN